MLMLFKSVLPTKMGMNSMKISFQGDKKELKTFMVFLDAAPIGVIGMYYSNAHCSDYILRELDSGLWFYDIHNADADWRKVSIELTDYLRKHGVVT